MPNDKENVSLSGALLHVLRKKCEEVELSLDELVEQTLRERFLESHGGGVSGEAMAFMSFAPSLPMEVTIKAKMNKDIVYLWANKLFLRMVGLQMNDIRGKTAKVVWKHHPGRARKLEALDRKVIQTGQPVVHVDQVSYGGEQVRCRVGIRFVIGATDARVVLLGSIGLDLSDPEVAQKVKESLGVDGQFQTVAVKKKVLPKKKRTR